MATVTRAGPTTTLNPVNATLAGTREATLTLSAIDGTRVAIDPSRPSQYLADLDAGPAVEDYLLVANPTARATTARLTYRQQPPRRRRDERPLRIDPCPPRPPASAAGGSRRVVRCASRGREYDAKRRRVTAAATFSNVVDVPRGRWHRRRRDGVRKGRPPVAQITINEGLAWLKTLKKRHEELLAIRNDNQCAGKS